MKKPAAYFFDLDGVVLDSEGLYTQFWEETERMYPTGIPNFARAIKGTNLHSILAHFKPEDQLKVLERIHNVDSVLDYKLFPGAEDFIRGLKVPAVLVTSSDKLKLQHLYDLYPEFPGLFAAIIDGDLVHRGKPDPEGYLLASATIGVDPRDCIVLEDSLQGIHAGKAAGCMVWGIATTLPRAAVKPAADLTFDNIAEAAAYARANGLEG